MLSKAIKNIEYTFIVFFLLLGILVSSIGVTFCRYQVESSQNITFNVRGVGDYYILGESESTSYEYNEDSLEWKMNHEENTLNLNFKVTNTLNTLTPDTDTFFYLRIILSYDTEIKMGVKNLAGKDVYYTGLSSQLAEDRYEYCFVDENYNELKFELKGDQISSQFISLQMKGITDAFISEVYILEDAKGSEITFKASGINYVCLERIYMMS